MASDGPVVEGMQNTPSVETPIEDQSQRPSRAEMQWVLNASITASLAIERRLQADSSDAQNDDKSDDESNDEEEENEEENEVNEENERNPMCPHVDGNKTTLNLEPRLYSAILLSDYFTSLKRYTSFDGLRAEMDENIWSLEAWFDAPGGQPSNAFCILLRMHQLSITWPNLGSLLNNVEHPLERCMALLYLRFAIFKDIDRLSTIFCPLFDNDRALVHLDHRKTQGISVGEFAFNLLKKLRYLGTLLPRFPLRQAEQMELILHVPLEGYYAKTTKFVRDAPPPTNSASSSSSSSSATTNIKSKTSELSTEMKASPSNDDKDNFDQNRPRYVSSFNKLNTSFSSSSSSTVVVSQSSMVKPKLNLPPELDDSTELSFKDRWAQRQRARQQINAQRQKQVTIQQQEEEQRQKQLALARRGLLNVALPMEEEEEEAEANGLKRKISAPTNRSIVHGIHLNDKGEEEEEEEKEGQFLNTKPNSNAMPQLAALRKLYEDVTPSSKAHASTKGDEVLDPKQAKKAKRVMAKKDSLAEVVLRL